MPTGYTYPIEENPDYTFNQFVWDCAHAFGALMHMRDDSKHTPVRAVEVDPYYMKQVKETQAALEEAKVLTLAEATTRLETMKAQSLKEAEEDRLVHEAQAKRYQSMKAHVEAWTPPSPDHENLKKFMLEQIALSVRTPGRYVNLWEFYTPEQFLAEELESAMRDLAHAHKQLAEHLEAVVKANKWVSDLTLSVGPPGGSPT